jgi:50S ribosomal protein L16 3-hydroxylase
MAWRKAARGAKLYVNGQGHDLPVRDAKSVANAREIDGAAYATLSQAGRDCVHELQQAGHYRLDIGGEEEE